MAEQDIREKVAEHLALDFFVRCLQLPEGVTVYSEAIQETDYILGLLKERGWQQIYIIPSDGSNVVADEVERADYKARIKELEFHTEGLERLLKHEGCVFEQKCRKLEFQVKELEARQLLPEEAEHLLLRDYSPRCSTCILAEAKLQSQAKGGNK